MQHGMWLDDGDEEGGISCELEVSDESEIDRATMDAESCSDSDSELEDSKPSPQWLPKTPGVGLRNIQFTKENKLLVTVPGSNRPSDWFEMVLDDVFFDTIVGYTNKYAREELQDPNLEPESKMKQWTDLTKEELKTFVYLLIHMGMKNTHSTRDYWDVGLHDYLMSYFDRFMTEEMSRDRFLLIMKCIRFCEDDRAQAATDPAGRVKFLVNYFNEKMETLYQPSRGLFLDDVAMLKRDYMRKSFKLGISKAGVTLYSLYEPDGICLSFTIFCNLDEELDAKSHLEDVVMFLMRNRLNLGHSLYMKGHFNNYHLAAKLLAHGTFCTGPLRADNKFLPEDVKGARLEKGNTIARYADGVMVGKWRDKKDKYYISTEFDNEMASCTNRRGQISHKPVPIYQYDTVEEKNDKLRENISDFYPRPYKPIRWIKKVFVHFLLTAVINSYKLFKFANPGQKKMKLYDFQLELIKQLMPNSPMHHNPNKENIENPTH